MVQGFCSGAGQPGTLTELIALGAADRYLTQNPSITFWRIRYMKYTNFAMEAVPQTFNTPVSFGGDVQINLNRNGDLVYFMYLQIDLPGLVACDTSDLAANPCTNPSSFPCFAAAADQTNALPSVCDPCCDGAQPVPIADSTGCDTATGDDGCAGLTEPWVHWINAVGQYIIEDACVVIGGQPIDHLYGDYLYMWEELSGKPGKRLHEMIGKRFTRTQLIDDSRHARTLYVPLPFWFTRSSGNALALVSLQFHNVRVHFKLRRLQDLIQTGASANADDSSACPAVFNVATCQPLACCDLTAQLLISYVYLDIEERDRFAVGSMEQLIHQTQFFSQITSQSSVSFNLNFNHPVIELIWAVRRLCQESVNNWCNYSGKYGLDPIETVSLCLNNQVRFQHPGTYLRLVQPYQHHTHLPEGYIYNYSFALYPEEPQPSGSTNFSRIDNVEIGFEFQDGLFDQCVDGVSGPGGSVRVLVFARNWNIFRYRDGLGGIAFSN